MKKKAAKAVVQQSLVAQVEEMISEGKPAADIVALFKRVVDDRASALKVAGMGKLPSEGLPYAIAQLEADRLEFTREL